MRLDFTDDFEVAVLSSWLYFDALHLLFTILDRHKFAEFCNDRMVHTCY